MTTAHTSLPPHSVAPATPSPVTRPLRVLQVAAMLGGLSEALAGASGALLARQIGGSDALAGLPQALLVAGAAVSGLALSALTRRRGRRTALAAGLLVALAGCATVVAGSTGAAGGIVAAGGAPTGGVTAGAGVGVGLAGGVGMALGGVLAGSLLLGAGNTVVMLTRYAAADLVPDAARGRAMGAVLAATTVGAVAGPNLLAPAGRLAGTVGLTALAGPYVVAAVGFVVAAAVVAGGLRGGRPAPDTSLFRHTTAPRARMDRTGTTGLAVLTIANLVMVGVMTMAPVHLHHAGRGLGAIGLVISLHIAGMFAPSPVSGWLTDRLGAPRTAALAGVVLTLAAGTAAVAAEATWALAAGLALLGVGWNLALLSGSALLTAGVAVADRPRHEGRGEVGMGAAAAAAGLGAGPVMAGAGYATLAATGAIIAATLPVLLRWWRGTLTTVGDGG